MTVVTGRAAYFAALRALVAKHIILERRGLETVVVTAGFSLLVVVMFHFTFDVRGAEAARLFPGALWTALFFAGTIGLARQGGHDDAEGRELGLLMAPVDRSVIFLAQVLFHLGLMLLVEAVAVPMFLASFGLNKVAKPSLLIAALFLGTWGLVALGSLLAGVSGARRGAGMLLPLLLFPLLVPVALGGAAVVEAAMTGETTALTGTWLRVLLLFDVVFTVIPALFYEYFAEV